ncbi:RRXRR domain-containing protein [Selenomonas montiformis]|uniref:RRXRR domain-containing protein n=1 Tax=Selenomonas montiformis TaxID=2652285 RepID=UPI003F8A63AA
MYVVYVLDKEGNPLMPTKRFGHVRKLMNAGLAKPVSTKPFVIRLLYESTKYTQPLYGGIDPGRTNIGAAVVNQKGDVVYAANIVSRNQQIPKLMANRAAHRRASRRGERLRRKRRAKKCGTTTEFPDGRKLPGYKDGVLALKDIINTESKFGRRKRPAGWITPTARQCVQTHISVIKQICQILPVNDWTLEYNKFAFIVLEHGKIYGLDFQNGRLKGYDSAENYVFALQDGYCALCDDPIDHYHHIVPRHLGGSNTPENLVGLCEDCHSELHTNKKLLDRIGLKKKYAGTAIANTAMPFIYNEIEDMFGKEHTHICTGRDTFAFRKEQDVAKDHFVDAVCIAAIGGKTGLSGNIFKPFEIRQFRNHDRQIVKAQHERTYKVGKKTIAKNRKPRFEQPKKTPALSDWYETLCNTVGMKEARKQLSQVKVVKSTRQYNNLSRKSPGTVFYRNNIRYVMTGNITNGQYFRAYGQGEKNFPRKECILGSRQSLVYVS